MRLPLFIALWLGLVGGHLHAVTLTAPPQVAVEKGAATITWQTDVECGTRLNYGPKPDALTQRIEGEVSTTHSVRITGLQPGATYYFAVGSAKTRLATSSFTTSTSPSRTGAVTTSTSPSTQPPGPEPTPKPEPGLLAKVLKLLVPDEPAPQPRPKPKPAPSITTTTQAPPTRATWGNLPALQDHFDRHGGDFGATSPDDYAAKAWLFRERARASSLPMKLDTDGTTRMWDGKTGSFAAYNRNGTTKTYFKPGNPSYWQRQPGRSIGPDQLPFR